ncbi:MAG TPA: hypothetical protein VFW47_18580, partial [Phenylobacterium sp.]|nr:hypothetical protein [Phenylobacterium sp.]
APKIVALQSHFPPEPPWSIKLISSSRTEAWRQPKGAPERATLNYLYAFATKRLVIDLVVEHHGWVRVYERKPLRTGEIPPRPVEPKVEETEPPKPQPGERPYKAAKVYKLVSMQVTPVDPAQVAANTFLGTTKTPRQWAFLFATFGTPVAMLAAAIAALRAKGLQRKWLWVILSFVGVGAAWMNWTTGEIGAVWAVNLVGFGLDKGQSPLSPWVLHLAPPAGALLVALRLWLGRGVRPRT